MQQIDTHLDFLGQKFFYISALNLVSPCFRGELFTRLMTRLTNLDLDIFGGEPGYLHGYSSNKIIENKHVKYHPSNDNYLEAQYIYASSKINLNITSLQFDDAVVNRVIDVGAVGGFILTDWKPALQKLTSVHKEISYRTIDELSSKINYYLSHEEERLIVAEKLHQDISSQCTYSHLIKDIISKISQMPAARSKPIQIDLGCGPRKPEGFVGVDSYPWSEVDVIADLNETFPFPDNSVDRVRAYDVIEHLPDRVHTMNEIWRVCKPNAIVDISVPSTDGRGAFQDPTHVSFWNINSFQYYCIEFPAYITLCRSYGFQGAFRIISLEHEESPDGVIHVVARLQAIKSTEVELSEDITNNLKLRRYNLVIFPDWLQSEELLFADLTDVIQRFTEHPNKSQITLLINTQTLNTSEIEPELLLSSIILNLTLNEGLDFTENQLEISLIPELNSQQWEAFLQKISGRVILNHEDRKMVEILKLTTLTSFSIDEIANLRMQ
jgi:SAM-dependent methyltransferase